MQKLIKLSLLSIFILFIACEQNIEKNTPENKNIDHEKYEIPDILHNIEYNGDGLLIINDKENNNIYTQKINDPIAVMSNFEDAATGTDTGIKFDFKNEKLNGKLYYGFILQDKMKYPQPVYFKKYAEINNGIAEFNIRETFQGKYDIANWVENGYGHIGYRVMNEEGKFLYDGKLLFEANDQGGIEVVISITEGPFINMLTPQSAVISFKTNKASICKVKIDGKEFKDPAETKFHEIPVMELAANTKYDYEIIYGDHSFYSNFKTAPENGSRQPFKFAFASDSRSGPAGGERNIHGANAYMMKKIAALAAEKDVAFWQFTGDMIDGYLSSVDETKLQYANWKRSIDAFSSSFPVYVGMGNHEALIYEFHDKEGKRVSVDKFPYDKFSAEKIFADEYVNFMNGPTSEDKSQYDPNTDKIDFPSYDENVYYYTYDNVAMIVLNSDYWYSPGRSDLDKVGGNLHGYIMDNQLEWLENTLQLLEADNTIDHIFVTQHTPAFPNGGHAKDDMWYDGDNQYRPFIAGKAVEKGIIERRDEYLKLLIANPKVIAILTGDEHNYSRLKLDKNTNIYPDDWEKEKIYFDRPLWHICNGSAGAPYYGQEVLPWSNSVEIFSTQYALCFFEIHGSKVKITVQDPDTYEIIETVKLR